MSRLSPILIVAALTLTGCDPPTDRAGQPVNLARIRLRTYPKGARVWVDGKLLVESTPATLILTPGAHHLKIQLPKAEPIERTLEVTAGQVDDITIRVPPSPEATIAVLSDRVGAEVRINGYKRGVTPLAGVNMKPGDLDITVMDAEGGARSVQSHLSVGQHRRVEVFFDVPFSSVPVPPPPIPPMSLPPPSGRVTIGLEPAGRVITEAGVVLGSSPLHGYELPPGLHALLLRTHDGRFERRVRVEVKLLETTVYRFMLTDVDAVEGWVAPPKPDAGLRKP